MDNKVEITISSCLSNLALVRSFARLYLEHYDVSDSNKVKLLSVIDELTTNSVEHGYSYSQGSIKIVMWIEGEYINISVEDFGKGYDENSKSKTDGGIGIIMTKKLVDDFKVLKKQNGTLITIKKRIREVI